MGSVVVKAGVKRQDGWLYYVDKKGDVARVNMKRKGKPYKKKVEVLAKTGIKRQKGYLYYLDNKGCVCMAKMARK
ncbi:hypothetical protein HYV84_05725 [Candidatus Woesearchaeota archaeon]|nr:hypothetical protein [Candidatus Woesearchaeota archaeon]